jgi:hypothetical protein
MKTCTVCEVSLDLNSFRFSKNGMYDVHSICRPCERKLNKERADEKQRAVQEYKIQKGCNHCGYNDNPYALQLNHIDPATKDPGLKASGHAYRNTWGWQKIWRELEKCEVLCANCHAVHTHKEGRYFDNNPFRSLQDQRGRREGSRD